MVRQSHQIRDPVRIYRPAILKGPADPRAVILLAVRPRGMHRIVQEDDARAFLRKRVHLLRSLANHACPVGKNDHDFGIVEHRRFLRPALHDGRLHIETALLVQGLREQLAASVELVLPRPVAASAGEEDDLRRGGGDGLRQKGGQAEQRNDSAEEMGGGIHGWMIVSVGWSGVIHRGSKGKFPIDRLSGGWNHADGGGFLLMGNFRLFPSHHGRLELETLRQVDRHHIRIAAHHSALAGEDFGLPIPALILETDSTAGQVSRGGEHPRMRARFADGKDLHGGVHIHGRAFERTF